MDEELKRVADMLDQIVSLFERLDNRLAPPPPPVPGAPVYLSGRWKLRDGTMYGR